MENQIVKLPEEVLDLAKKVAPSKKEEVELVLTQIFTGTDEWERQVDSIEVKGVDDKMSIQLAEVARKNAKQARVNAEKVFDAKRVFVQNQKAEYDLEDKLWLKAKQVMQIKFKAIEEKAEWKANYIKRYEAEQKELRTQNRILQVAQYAEINRVEFENMSDEVFESFVSGLKSEYERKAEQTRIEIAERVEKERIEAEQIEAQRLENIRLKAEAEQREKEIEEERKANEIKLAAERAAAKAEADRIEAEQAAKLKAEKEEKKRLASELKAKQEEEEKIIREKQAAEEKAKKEAEKAAKAPIKKQMISWVESFQAPNITVSNEKVELIMQKFEEFKSWAKHEIENS